ncbi:MAG: SH3 domain-containing protein [Burkholderiaceae bacterium]
MRSRQRLAAGLAGLVFSAPLWLPTWARADEPANPAPPPAAAPPVASTAPAPAGEATPLLARVRVVGPYLDMRSGPGRGYPIFQAAERDEWVVIELRHTDWFKVRNARGAEGWVSREQMKQTVTEDGTPFELADPSLADFLNRRFDIGAGYGASKKTSITRLWAGWRMSDTLSLDLNIAEVQSRTSTTGLWTASLLSEPWSDKRISPFFGVGVGRFHYEPNKSLVNREVIDGNMGAFTLGVRYHLSGRAAVRVDYSRYSVLVSDTDYRRYQAGTVGLSIHF